MTPSIQGLGAGGEGFRTILAIDFDVNAAATYRANFPETRVECGPVVEFISSMPYADVVIGGPPCQPHSLAGKRKASADDRDGGPDFINAVCKSKPRHFLMENVPGLLSSEGGKYWQKLYACMEDAGYVLQYRVLDAVNYGVPQFRARLWVWGIRRDVYESGVRHSWPVPTHAWPWPEPSMFGDTLLPAVTVGIALNIPHRQCDGALGGGSAKQLVRIMGGGSNPHFAGDVRTERDITGEPSTTIPTSDNHSNAIPYRWSDAMLAKHPPASPASPASTILGKFYKGGAEGLVECTIDPRHPFQQQQQPANTLTSGGNGHGPTENSLKLSVDGRTWESRHPVADETEPMQTLRARSPRDGGRCTENVIKERGLVRRLAPLECARLQSMPDDFRWPEKISKTAQYKIIGNGQASAMVWHLRQAIEKSDPGIETVISLFCGGGVGDCGFHGRFWKYENSNSCKAGMPQLSEML